MPLPDFSWLAGGTLGSINIAAAAAVGFMIPLIAEIDLAIGLVGGLKLELSASFNAAVSFNINFTNPLAMLAAAIQASIQVIAGLQAALALGIPPLSISISASVAFAAAISAKIGLLNIFIDVALGIVLAPINFLASLQAALSAGPVALYGWENMLISTLKTQIGSHDFSDGGFTSGSLTYGVMLMTAAPSAYAGMKVLFAI